MSLRSRIIRAAYAHPEVRAHLLPLLGPSQNTSGVMPLVPPVATPMPVAAPVQVSPQVPVVQPPQVPVVQPVVIVQPPTIIMPGATVPVVGTPPATNLNPPLTAPDGTDVFVMSRTQQGFLSDLAPELDRMLTTGMSRPQVAEWAKVRVRDAFREKDGLYLILIRHQSTFESDAQFLLGLERAIDIWSGGQGNANAPGV